MITDTAHLEKVCEKKLRTGGTLDDVIEYLHVQGVSILDAIKVVRNASGMSLGDAKQAVSCHAAWQTIAKANEALHDESEAASREEKQRTSSMGAG
jgi:hypothetical protein